MHILCLFPSAEDSRVLLWGSAGACHLRGEMEDIVGYRFRKKGSPYFGPAIERKNSGSKWRLTGGV